MKKLILILITGMFLCNISYGASISDLLKILKGGDEFAKDLTGTILSCPWPTKPPKMPVQWSHLNIKFISKHQAYLTRQIGFSYHDYTYDYKVYPKAIYLGKNSYVIDRVTLEFFGYLKQENVYTRINKRNCKIVEDENFDIKKDIEEKVQEALDVQEKLNKI